MQWKRQISRFLFIKIVLMNSGSNAFVAIRSLYLSYFLAIYFGFMKSFVSQPHILPNFLSSVILRRNLDELIFVNVVIVCFH